MVLIEINNSTGPFKPSVVKQPVNEILSGTSHAIKPAICPLGFICVKNVCLGAKNGCR